MRVFFLLAALAIVICQSNALAQTERAGVALIASEGEGLKHWPRWRGPSGQGLAVGSGFPDRWSNTQNVFWKTAVPGRGHSSPIIWRDRIYLTTAYNDGRASVLAFDRASGKRIWETFVPDTTPEYLHQK